MKQLYSILILTVLTLYSLSAQTTVTYTQQAANYATFFSDGGGNFDNGATELGMWANGGNKQSVGWRNFTQDGTTTGTLSTMAVGDSFTITLNATRSYGQIGLALLSSPTATASWADRINNYAVQVNLNGNGGAFDPWEVVSVGGTINASTISGSTTATDFVFKFTLNSATSMTVDINNGTQTFNVTINNQNITGYAVYINDDWNGSANSNIIWKPTTEYTYATTLGINDVTKNTMSLNLIDNVIHIEGLNYNQKFKLNVFDLNGRLVKKLNEKSTLNLNGLSPSVYILKLKTDDEKIITKKVIKS
ncbi:T9SS type A sorting domain-containing protein [Lutibacter sp.]|uniref:T9SS type A sorting domain-containing protein n=1 Tax=Lutibacter sp. TaxID=1925666 RepID=UPI0025BD234B|nr:T9SS type A sorting domain-containing protein [Lutibacter sp.]MCF6182030.1 T9SS type A sorting domain-containing protein [Lutibacter sp.]